MGPTCGTPRRALTKTRVFTQALHGGRHNLCRAEARRYKNNVALPFRGPNQLRSTPMSFSHFFLVCLAGASVVAAVAGGAGSRPPLDETATPRARDAIKTGETTRLTFNPRPEKSGRPLSFWETSFY